MLAASLVLAASCASAAFPQTFTGLVRTSLGRDPFYASRLLAGVERETGAVARLRRPPAIRAHLEGAVGDPKLAKAQLEAGTLDADKAAALLVANSLARPAQFREILDGLETVRPGLGAKTAELMGARKPQPAWAVYGRDGRLDSLFDGSAAPSVYDATPVPAQDYAGKSRPSGLTKPK